MSEADVVLESCPTVPFTWTTVPAIGARSTVSFTASRDCTTWAFAEDNEACAWATWAFAEVTEACACSSPERAEATCASASAICASVASPDCRSAFRFS